MPVARGISVSGEIRLVGGGTGVRLGTGENVAWGKAVVEPESVAAGAGPAQAVKRMDKMRICV